MNSRAFSSWQARIILMLVLLVNIGLASDFESQSTGVKAADLQLDPNMQQTWERTDKPIADGLVSRSWLWGPKPLYILEEPYNQGNRLVAYYDKGRMEVNKP